MPPQIWVGRQSMAAGRAGEAPSTGLTERLVELGFETDRLKTGTPARVDKRTVNFSGGDHKPTGVHAACKPASCGLYTRVLQLVSPQAAACKLAQLQPAGAQPHPLQAGCHCRVCSLHCRFGGAAGRRGRALVFVRPRCPRAAAAAVLLPHPHHGRDASHPAGGWNFGDLVAGCGCGTDPSAPFDS